VLHRKAGDGLNIFLLYLTHSVKFIDLSLKGIRIFDRGSGFAVAFEGHVPWEKVD
jgi:hypothetical protein